MAKTFVLDQYELSIEVQRDSDGFLATSPNWADCYAQGDTPEEAVSELIAVAGSLVELYKEEGLKVPLALRRKATPLESFQFKFPLVVAAS